MLNRIMARDLPQEPEVGMGATRLMWSDRRAGTITEIYRNKAGKVIEIAFQEDTAKMIDGSQMSERQIYEYERNPEAPIYRYTLRKDGTYVRLGDPLRNGERLMVGTRMEYRDPSF